MARLRCRSWRRTFATVGAKLCPFSARENPPRTSAAGRGRADDTAGQLDMAMDQSLLTYLLPWCSDGFLGESPPGSAIWGLAASLFQRVCLGVATTCEHL